MREIRLLKKWWQYFRDPEATKKSFRGGYFGSGDLAVMHEGGSISIQDRSKDIIISGGEASSHDCGAFSKALMEVRRMPQAWPLNKVSLKCALGRSQVDRASQSSRSITPFTRLQLLPAPTQNGAKGQWHSLYSLRRARRSSQGSTTNLRPT